MFVASAWPFQSVKHLLQLRCQWAPVLWTFGVLNGNCLVYRVKCHCVSIELTDDAVLEFGSWVFVDLQGFQLWSWLQASLSAFSSSGLRVFSKSVSTSRVHRASPKGISASTATLFFFFFLERRVHADDVQSRTCHVTTRKKKLSVSHSSRTSRSWTSSWWLFLALET